MRRGHVVHHRRGHGGRVLDIDFSVRISGLERSPADAIRRQPSSALAVTGHVCSGWPRQPVGSASCAAMRAVRQMLCVSQFATEVATGERRFQPRRRQLHAELVRVSSPLSARPSGSA